MKLTWEEIIAIANRLDEIISNNFYEAIYDTILERKGNEELEASCEDILQIKEQLRRIL